MDYIRVEKNFQYMRHRNKNLINYDLKVNYILILLYSQYTLVAQ